MLREFFGIRLSHFHLHEQKFFESAAVANFPFLCNPIRKG